MVEGFSIVGFLNQLVDKHEESWIDAKYVNLIFSSILPTFKTRPSLLFHTTNVETSSTDISATANNF